MRRVFAVAIFAFLAGCGGRSVPAPAPTGTLAPNPGGPPALYIANVHMGSVMRLGADGTPQLTLNGGIAPDGVAVTGGGDVVVAGTRGSVLYFHPQSATPFNGFSSDAILGAKGVALDAAGNVYVGDVLTAQVYRFAAASSGSGITAQTSVHWIAQTQGGLQAFDVDAYGNIYVLAGTGGTAKNIFVYQVHDGGSASPTYTLATTIPASPDFVDADGLSVDASGNIYVLSGKRDVLEYAQDGTLQSKRQFDGLCSPFAVRHAALSDASSTQLRLYVADACGSSSGSQLAALDLNTPAPSGSPLTTPTPVPTPQFTIDVDGPGGMQGIAGTSTLAVDQSGGAQNGTVYVTTPLADIVSGYCGGCFGESPPSSQFSLGYPGMDGIQGLWFDNGLMYTMDSGANAVTMYPAPQKLASGTISPVPIARIEGPLTDMCGLAGLVTDAQHNLLATLACPDRNYVAKYVITPGMQGVQNVQAQVFGGTRGTCSASVLCNPQQLAVDKNGNVFVTNYGINPDVDLGDGSVVEFSAAGAIKAIVVGPDIHNPSGIAIDPQGNIAVLSNDNVHKKPGVQPEIAVFAAPPAQSSPNTPVTAIPLRVIEGSSTQLGGTPFPPMQMDGAGTIYVNEYSSVLVFAPGANGDAAPVRVYKQSGLMGGTGIALQP